MSTETTSRIAISRENLPKVIAKAFDLSSPQGMGFLHYREGGIPEDELNQILSRADETENPYRKNVRLDYVQGRAVKLNIDYEEGSQQWYIEGDSWFDHGTAAWEELKQFAQSMNSAALPA